MASPTLRESGISVMMRPWSEPPDVPVHQAPPASPAQRFWRALGQFIFDYNRY